MMLKAAQVFERLQLSWAAGKAVMQQGAAYGVPASPEDGGGGWTLPHLPGEQLGALLSQSHEGAVCCHAPAC